jgi:adenylate kinase
MDFNVIFIAGPQGSGKGTQGKKLAEKLGFFFWGMGAILREIQVEDIQFATKLSLLDGGTLLPDETIIGILKERLATVSREQGIVFDGVPRRLGQAEFLVPFLREQGREKMTTILIDLPREDSIKRLLLRAQSEKRVDDTPEAIENRFQFYDHEMTKTIDYLKGETTFIEVDGRPAVDVVEKSIDEAIGIVPPIPAPPTL